VSLLGNNGDSAYVLVHHLRNTVTFGLWAELLTRNVTTAASITGTKIMSGPQGLGTIKMSALQCGVKRPAKNVL
jgi:hypothetical protein